MPKEISLKNINFDRTLFLNLVHLFEQYFGTCALYSGGSYETSNRSFLGLFPYDLLWIHDNKLWREKINTDKQIVMTLSNPWDGLRSVMPDRTNDNTFPEWMGYLSYELGMHSDPEKKIAHHRSPIPEAYFQKCTLILAVDHQTGKAIVRIADQAEYLLGDEEKEWVQRLTEESKWEDLAKHLNSEEEDNASKPPLTLAKPIEPFDDYRKKVEKAKDLIHTGDIYQVNLSRQFNFHGKRNAYRLFHNLAKINPAPFSAFMRLKNFAIVSSSPERFLRKEEGWLETRPIKGTVARGKNPEDDRKQLESLLNSPKENSELLMITDLMRNDLGKVSIAGSVSTPQIRTCEAYENVYHLLSVIKSKALPGLHSIDILRACFPGGSITGCPKLSAMEVIADLEKRPRGLYTGSIGYLAGNGDFDFNIAIRTMLVGDHHIEVQLGGAIIADSDPSKEYEETLHKGASIFKALQLDNLQVLR